MDLKIASGVKTFRNPAAGKRAPSVGRNGSSAVAKSGGDHTNHTFRLNFDNVLTAEQDGYMDLDGMRVAVPEELRAAIRQAYDTAMAYNQAISARNTAIQTANAAKQQSEVLKERADSIKKALEIYRRIASGGRVPMKDERFLMQFSQAMYMAAKMEAARAKEHKKYDSVLKDEEERDSGDPDAGIDSTHYGVEAVSAAVVSE